MLPLATFPNLFPGFAGPLEIIWWVLLGLKLVALVDAAFRPRAVFVAADKLTKPGWMLILVVFTLSQIFQGWLSFFGLIGIVAVGRLPGRRPPGPARRRRPWPGRLGHPPPPGPTPALTHPAVRRGRTTSGRRSPCRRP